MRLQLVTHSYLPERTPPQRRWTAFVREFREAGWDVDVVVPRPDPHHTPHHTQHGAERTPPGGDEMGPHGERLRRSWAPAGLPATRAGRFAGHVVNALIAIPTGLGAPRPDVVVVTVPALPNAVAGWALARLRRVPLVVEMRDAWPDLARESGVRAGVLSRAMEAVVTGAQRAARVVVTVTEGFAERLRERGIEAVETIGNGVALEDIAPVPVRARRPGELHVLYLGNHGESQGLETVVRAAALLRDRAPGVTVRLVGRGTCRDELLALNAFLGSPAEMLDPVYGDELAGQYAWADTCVVALRPDWPSFECTVPSKTYELLAVGRHITGLVTGEAARLLEETSSADLVTADPEAAAALWERLAGDPSSTQVGDHGRDWVRRFADLPALGRRFVKLTARTVTG